MLNQFINSGDLIIDIEFGNQYGFFSGTRDGVCDKEIYGKKVIDRSFDVDNCVAKGKVKEIINIKSDSLVRELDIHAIQDSFLFDFVSRFVVLSNDRNAHISNVEIKHNNTNIYYQYSDDKPVKAPLGDKHWLEFINEGSSIEKYFDNVFYIRDESQSDGRYKWIVHHRKIVKPEYSELILRGCNPRIEGVIPYQEYLPRIIKSILFRIRERKYPNFPLMTVGVVNVKNDFLKIKTKLRLSEDA
ncbi:hypothetical protein [Aliivibrio fischeri]|uniref:hypothetical protein n=1 Tax=Aliivibrio fischeri TaxID=668 RepID=UPI00105FE35C|nr:hypothetical protein [Aliivibrio fischeri]TDM56044.1 hypothetical protein VFFQA001_00995 [Aliivibrio fischeri]